MSADTLLHPRLMVAKGDHDVHLEVVSASGAEIGSNIRRHSVASLAPCGQQIVALARS